MLSFDKNRDIIVCYGNVQVNSNENTPVHGIDYGDTEALIKAYSKFQNLSFLLGKEPKLLCNNLSNEVFDANIISIGGPRWNKVTEKLIGEIGSPLYYEKDKVGLLEKKEGMHVEPLEYKRTDKEMEDYGCWIFERKDKNKGARLIISGYTTAGVLIAAEALKKLNKEDYSFLQKEFKKKNKFAVIFKGKITISNSGEYSVIHKPETLRRRLVYENSFYDKNDYSYERGIY